jgi:acetylglutamate kinase
VKRKKVFVKVSGDLVERKDVLDWIRNITSGNNYVVICTGGGSQINEAFAERGIAPDFGALGRATKTFEERQLARDVLERNQARVQDLLTEHDIHAEVIIPVMYMGTVLCHVNGDILVLAAHHGFDKLFVLTLDKRQEKKREEFSRYPKIDVVAFPSGVEQEIQQSI